MARYTLFFPKSKIPAIYQCLQYQNMIQLQGTWYQLGGGGGEGGVGWGWVRGMEPAKSIRKTSAIDARFDEKLGSDWTTIDETVGIYISLYKIYFF